MLTTEQLRERLGLFNASENAPLLTGWKDKEPPKDMDHFDDLYPVLKKMREKGEPKPKVTPLKPSYPYVSGDLVSQIWTYLVFEDRKVPEGLVSYAKRKALEEYFDVDPSLNISNVHTRNGDEREVDAMIKAGKEIGCKFEHTGDNQLHLIRSNMGASPDGIVYRPDRTIHFGGEAKCKTPGEHMDLWLLDWGHQLEEHDFDHYVQIQTNIYCAEAEYWYLILYHPYALHDDIEIRVLKVERDDHLIKFLLKRVELATEIKLNYMKEIEAKRKDRAATKQKKSVKQLNALFDEVVA